MRPPYGTYRALAGALVGLAALNRSGGSVDALVAMHEGTEVADFLDDDQETVARHRRNRLVGAIVGVLTDYQDRHMEAPLRQSDSVSDFFVFAFADGPDEDPERRVLLARLRTQPELVREIYALDDRKFELLCGRLLELIGCDRVAVTRGTKDRGIDFLGRLQLSQGELPGARRMVLGAMNLALVGQAKRYGPDQTVGPNEVREIVGTWALILKARVNGQLEEHIADVIEDLGLRAEDPALHMVVTSARFTGAAVREARSGGVVLIDGIQLGFALARAGVGIEDQGDGEWLATAETVLTVCDD